MKTTAKMIAIVILLGAGSWLMTEKAQAHGWSHYKVFYQELRPYGTWINTPEYGKVWIPDVAPGFHPYSTSGYWVNTVYGWSWVSYYPWGWAPFHYGRWYYDDWYGWVWVPGTEWGPAWVSWSHCDGYYGWAPLGPGFHFSPTINIHIDIPVHHWIFIHGRHFGDRHQEKYHMKGRDNERFYKQAKPLMGTVVDKERNTRFFKGPEVRDVRKVSGRDFNTVAVRDDMSRISARKTVSPVKRTSNQKLPDRDYNLSERERPVSKVNSRSNEKVRRESPDIQPVKRQKTVQPKTTGKVDLEKRKDPVKNEQRSNNQKSMNLSNASRSVEKHPK